MCACADAGWKLGELENACFCTSGMVDILCSAHAPSCEAVVHSRSPGMTRVAGGRGVLPLWSQDWEAEAGVLDTTLGSIVST